MAHGMFKIKVVKTTNGEELYEYAACVYPQKGESLVIDGKRLAIIHISHILRTGRDSRGDYFDLDYVQVEVAK